MVTGRPPLPNVNLVTCKWEFRVKKGPDGNLRWKARLVARGFSQFERVDFEETYSPLVKFPTVQLMLELAISRRWQLRQLDVDNAFLNRDLKETVYTLYAATTRICEHKSSE